MNTANEVKQLGIQGYLTRQQSKGLLRIMTCGSVDDGKSTLIGRLLHDSHQIYEDQLTALHQDNEKVGNAGEALDLALLVDGLQAEREQGITIDVAYRYFSTDKRKFIIADTPGHEQYTRNMVTGASTSDVAIILVDARYGVQVQTKRHSYLCDSLGITQFVVAINKMDMVDFDHTVYDRIQADYLQFAKQLNIQDIQFIPISALHGDNVVNISAFTPYYSGLALLPLLETLSPKTSTEVANTRFPVQLVTRPDLDFRGYQGTLASGQLAVGDTVKILPSNRQTTIKQIVTFDGELQSASAGQAITLTLADEVDVSRGDVIVADTDQIQSTSQLTAQLVWMHESPLVLNKEYIVKLSAKKTTATVTVIDHKVDVNTLTQCPADSLQLNEIAMVQLHLTEEVVVDPYFDNRETGSFIMIDRLTNSTVGAGMVKQATTNDPSNPELAHEFSQFERDLNQLVRKHFPHWNARDITKL